MEQDGKDCNRRGGYRVLLVEDQLMVQRTIQRMLERRGHHVVAHDSGKSTLQAMADGLEVDAVITDYWMPGMTGPELLQALQSVTTAQFIVLTGVHAPVLPILDRRVRLLHKPVSITELDQALCPDSR